MDNQLLILISSSRGVIGASARKWERTTYKLV